MSDEQGTSDLLSSAYKVQHRTMGGHGNSSGGHGDSSGGRGDSAGSHGDDGDAAVGEQQAWPDLFGADMVQGVTDAYADVAAAHCIKLLWKQKAPGVDAADVDGESWRGLRTSALPLSWVTIPHSGLHARCIRLGPLYGRTSLIRSSFIRILHHPEESRWLPIYSICHAYIQYVCSIIRFPRLSGYLCEKRMCAVKRGLTVLEMRGGGGA